MDILVLDDRLYFEARFLFARQDDQIQVFREIVIERGGLFHVTDDNDRVFRQALQEDFQIVGIAVAHVMRVDKDNGVIMDLRLYESIEVLKKRERESPVFKDMIDQVAYLTIFADHCSFQALAEFGKILQDAFDIDWLLK